MKPEEPHKTQGPARKERDALGEIDIAADALWGIHTERALRNFALSKRRVPLRADRRHRHG